MKKPAKLKATTKYEMAMERYRYARKRGDLVSAINGIRDAIVELEELHASGSEWIKDARLHISEMTAELLKSGVSYQA